MIWDVLIDRKGVNRIQTELLLRKAQSGDTGALDTLITAYYTSSLQETTTIDLTHRGILLLD